MLPQTLTALPHQANPLTLAPLAQPHLATAQEDLPTLAPASILAHPMLALPAPPLDMAPPLSLSIPAHPTLEPATLTQLYPTQDLASQFLKVDSHPSELQQTLPPTLTALEEAPAPPVDPLSTLEVPVWDQFPTLWLLLTLMALPELPFKTPAP